MSTLINIEHPSYSRVAVLGGGIAGLACAHLLLKAGYRPTVFEASSRVGGLGASFDHKGTPLDCFYHVMLDSDAELRALIDEVGLSEQLVWQETGMGFHAGGQLYGFNTPLDLLRFAALPLASRIRMGIAALYVTRLCKNAQTLDEVPATEWLRRVFGGAVTERIWLPLLRAKFGDRIDTLPAYWVWNTLNREKNGRQEVKGYLRGGYTTLAERLVQLIQARGGEVRLNAAVTSLSDDASGVVVQNAGEAERFSAAISTLPLGVLARLTQGSLREAIPNPELRYQGVVNALVVMRRRLERFYWTVVVHPAFRFGGVVETTHVIPPEWIGNRHLAYLMNYADAESPLYQRSDAVVERDALEGLRAVYPNFRRSDVEAVHVFRAPHVEPVWSIGYLRRRPVPRIDASHVYMCTTAQAYPRVTAWNTSVALAGEVVGALTRDLQSQHPVLTNVATQPADLRTMRSKENESLHEQWT